MSGEGGEKKDVVWLVAGAVLSLMILGPLLLEFWSFRAGRSVQEWDNAMRSSDATIQDVGDAVRKILAQEPETRILSIEKRYRAMEIKTAEIGDAVAGNTYSFERPDQTWQPGAVRHSPIEGVSPSDMFQILAVTAKDAAMTEGHGFAVTVMDGEVTVSAEMGGGQSESVTLLRTNDEWVVSASRGHGVGGALEDLAPRAFAGRC